MASSFTVVNGNTTIDFNYTAATATIQAIVGDCAERLWNAGMGDHGTDQSPILFSSLNNNQKLAIVEDHIKNVVVEMANTHKLSKAQATTLATENASKYSL